MAVPGGRNRYYRALHERLKAMCTLAKTCEPGVVVSNLSTDAQPAVSVHVADQLVDQEPRMFGKHFLGAIVELSAVATSDPYKTADEVLNDLVDQVEAALERQPGERVPGNGEEVHTTLGGLVQRCWINDGIVFTSTGDASNQAIALVPVVMLVVGGKRQLTT